MTLTIEEIRRSANIALGYTGIILTESLRLDFSRSNGAACCVYVIVNQEPLAITCQHVVANNDTYYINATATRPTPDEIRSMPDSDPSWPIAVWKAGDLAIFRVDEEQVNKNKRQLLELGTAPISQPAELVPNTTAIICGIWAEESEYVPVFGTLLLNPFPYAAKGVVSDVANHRITARFEENDIFVFGGNDQDRAKKINTSGGSRDLKGMSGSGLWIPQANGPPSFAGILSHPKTEEGDPDIEFTPAWGVLRFIERFFPRDSSPAEATTKDVEESGGGMLCQ